MRIASSALGVSLSLVALLATLASSACDTAEGGAGGTGSTSSTTGSTRSTASTTGSGAMAELGMNDVTFVLPLPTGAAPILFRASDPSSDGQPLLPKSLVESARDTPTNPGAIGDVYTDLEVVAARFDLCDRASPEPCKDADDARFRLVFQPILDGQASDVGFHVFYEIPQADIPSVLDALRVLAAKNAIPTASPLQVNTSLGADADYTDGLRSLLASHCTSSRIVRVTLMGQVFISAALRWIFHGIERGANGMFVEIPIAPGAPTAQEVLQIGTSSYDLTPAIDGPTGFQLAVDENAFAAAAPAEQANAIDALLAANHPTKNVPNTVQCAACHVSTYLLAERVKTSGIDPTTLPSAFTTTFDTSVAAGTKDSVLLRGLGYRSNILVISQRVANETAEVLTEIAARK